MVKNTSSIPEDGDDLNVENDTSVHDFPRFVYTDIISILVDSRPPRVLKSGY